MIKATLDGKILGSVEGLVGHLGCIAFNDADGCVYGSLEYKNDAIGKGILNAIHSDSNFSDAFYIVKFDVAKIDRLDIPAENSDIMSAVYLKEVAKDYNGFGTDKNGNSIPHKYACSGIDGVTFGPLPGKSENDGYYLYVAYGIYGDVNRDDNNYQILLCYDLAPWSTYAQPLDQKNMHCNGPDAPLHKFFVFTGNTCYGVQNLEYDHFINAFLMAVYKGNKAEFPNYSLFAVDAGVQPEFKKLSGINEVGEVLQLKSCGSYDEKSGVYGWYFPYGSTGLYSFGDGNWLISHRKSTPEGQCGYIYPYVWDNEHPFSCKVSICE